MILRIVKEYENDSIFEVKDEKIIIGRGSDSQIVINDDLVSRSHARIIYDEGSYWVEDLNSTNGTYVNEKPIERSILKTDDKINIGKAVLFVQKTHTDVEIRKKPALHIVDTVDSKSSDMLSMHPKEASLLLKPDKKENLEVLSKENENLKKLFRLNSFITSTRNIKVLTDKIMSLAFEMINADNVCILFVHEKTKELEVKSMMSKHDNKTVTVSRTIVNHVLEKSFSVLSSDAMDDSRFNPGKSIISANIKSVVCTPIRIEDKVLGIFYADMRSLSLKFSEGDLKIVTILANMIGIAMENDFWHREAIRKERLSAMGEVITGISHYAKNILNGLKLGIEALEMSIKKKSIEKTQKSMKAIRAQEKRISNLVLNMLDYSKERVPVKQHVDIREVVGDIISPYTDFFTKNNIRCYFDINSSVPEIKVDITGIHRILLNLFTNALDAIKKTPVGIIRIAVDHKSDPDLFTISVEDNGTGMEKKCLERIFDVFYSTKNFEGTGLGLAVAKKTVEEHGGTISVESELGKGSKIIIKLPQ